jgi:DNA-binding CsgD family transcriptional regulator
MGRLGPLLSPLLVGRDELLTLTSQRLDEAAAGRGRSLLLAGEAGVGKTRLLRAILRKAQQAGFRIAKGDLAPQDAQVPLASVLDLARTMRQDPAFGGLGEELLSMPVDRGEDSLTRRRLLVRDIAERIVDETTSPTLLAFEDLQWADELSLELVGELARLGHDRPLIVLATYREDELPSGSIHREWRARLLGQRLAEEVRLVPLTFDETALVTSLILGTGLPASREVVNAVYARTDGIPLHIEELLGSIGDAALTDGRAILEANVPDTIEDAILARVGRLSGEAQAVARGGAVIGRCFEPSVLAGVLDRRVEEIELALEELVEGSVLYPFEFVDRGYYDFRHQLLRDAVYRTIGGAELRRLHARAGEFGAQLVGASEIHASLHFERAGLRPQAFRAALAGARAANAVSSRREAFELYGRAVANMPGDLTPAERAALYDGYCEAALAVDNVAIALETTDQARHWHEVAGQPIDAANALMVRASMARRDVWAREERLRLLAASSSQLEKLERSPEQQLAMAELRYSEAVLALDGVDLETAAVVLGQARAFTAASSDPDEGDIDFMSAQVDVLTGSVDAGLADMLRISREARDAQREGTGVTAYRVAAALAARVMDYDTAAIGLAEGLRYADEIQQSYCRHILASTSAHVAWARGDWDEAIAIGGVELVEPGSRRGTLGSRDTLGFVAFGRGEVDQARALLLESLAIGMAAVEVELVMPALWGLAETALVAGEPHEATDRCEAGFDLARRTGERALFVPFVVTGVRAYQEARRPSDAEAWLAQARVHLAGWDRARIALEHGDGLVRLAAGSTVSARTGLQTAVDGWARLGRIWESAWARLDLAACLIRGHRHAEALPVLEDVRVTADRLASGPIHARVDELAGIARRRGVTEEPWRPLTAREFGVARLITEGMTNAAIAEELSLSPKTVSAHVEHILAKLGAMRRAEIAAWVTTIAVPAAAEPAAAPAHAAAKPARDASAGVQLHART